MEKKNNRWLVIGIIILAVVLLKYGIPFSIITPDLIYQTEFNDSGLSLIAQSSKDFGQTENLWCEDSGCYYYQKTIYDNNLDNFGIDSIKTRNVNKFGQYADSTFRTLIYTKDYLINTETLNKLTFRIRLFDSASYSGCVSTRGGSCLASTQPSRVYESITNNIYLVNENESIKIFSNSILNDESEGVIILFKDFDFFILAVNGERKVIDINGSYKLLIEKIIPNGGDEDGTSYIHNNHFKIYNLELTTGGTSTVNNTFNFYNTIELTNHSIVYINQTYYQNQTINQTIDRTITDNIPSSPSFFEKYRIIGIIFILMLIIITFLYLKNKKKK